MNRTALVTGATSGIGEAIAEKFVKENIKVILSGRAMEIPSNTLKDAVNESQAFYFNGDLNNGASKSLFNFAYQQLGDLPSIIVINAGIGLPGTLITSDETKWLELFQTNCISAMQIMRIAGQAILSSFEKNKNFNNIPKDLIITSSIAGRLVSESNPVYGATKFAITSLGESLRKELCHTGTRVTVLEPGFVKSNFQQNAGYDPEKFSNIENQFGPLLSPQDIANLIYFVINLPKHINTSNIIIRPTKQII